MPEASTWDTRPSATGERFALAVRSEASRTSPYVSDRGVALSDRQIFWMIGDETFSQPLARLTAVALKTEATQAGALPMCRLSFDDAAPLRIVACSAAGFPNRDQERVFRAFLEALHHRLTKEDRAHIAFSCGYDESRLWLYKVGLYFAGFLFVTALLSLPFSHSPRPLVLLVSAAGMFWRVKTASRAAAPKRYDPDHIPNATFG
jgi:hypothetical protein